MAKNRIPGAGLGATARNGHGVLAAMGPSPQPAPRQEPDLPPLSEEDQAALESFHRRQQVLRDLTIGCIEGNHTGAHIFGPPGGSKSHTILKTLRDRKAYFQHHQRITAKPLYLELEKHPGAVHLVEDCEQLFCEKSALTLLRSALGGERVRGRRERRVSYSVSGSRARVLEHYFYGAIIFTANRPLSDERPEVRGVMSRIPCLGHAPPDHEVRAVMRHVARQGHVGEAGRMTPEECVEVVEHVIQVASELECRLDLRWIEHGYAHYLTHVESGGTVDWRDQVKFHMMETLTYFDHTPAKKPAQSEGGDLGKQDYEQQNIAAALEIHHMSGLSGADKVKVWEERTGLSRPQYYRYRNKGLANLGQG